MIFIKLALWGIKLWEENKEILNCLPKVVMSIITENFPTGHSVPWDQGEMSPKPLPKSTASGSSKLTERQWHICRGFQSSGFFISEPASAVHPVFRMGELAVLWLQQPEQPPSQQSSHQSVMRLVGFLYDLLMVRGHPEMVSHHSVLSLPFCHFALSFLPPFISASNPFPPRLFQEPHMLLL